MTLEQFISDLAPAVKTAKAKTEVGQIAAPSKHVTVQTEDDAQTATEGAQSAGNERLLNVDRPGGKPNTATKTKAAGGDVVAPQTATLNPTTTGESPDQETAGVISTSGKKKDPQDTKHPASPDNDELNGGKFASLKDDELYQLFCDQANEGLAAELGQHAATIGKAANAETPAAPAAAVAQPEQVELGEKEAEIERNFGWAAARMLAGRFDKQAAMAANAEIVEDLFRSADNVVAVMVPLLKTANDQVLAQLAAGGGPGPGAGGPSAGGDPMGGGGDPSMETNEIPIEVLQQLLAGGGMPGGEGGGMPGGEGGGPPGAPPMGGEGGGGDPNEAGEGGEETDLDDIQALLAASGEGGPQEEEPAGEKVGADKTGGRRKSGVAHRMLELLKNSK